MDTHHDRPLNQGAARAPIVRLTDVVKRFGVLTALDGVSLDLAPGELFALLGPSGCGKTTLLRVIAGFERPDRGRVAIDGKDMTDTPPHARPVNTVFQSYALFPHMSVAENIAFGPKQDGLPRAVLAERVKAMVALAQLQGMEDRKPAQLSGGQRQRVALARALAKEPRVLLLDEPLAALDRKLREDTRFELLAVQRRLGITFLYVTHDQDEALSLSHRMAVMDRGAIAQLGRPRDIYERPASRYVADFIGGVNLLTGRVIGREGGTAVVQLADGVARIADDTALAIGSEIAIAIRPERLRPTPVAGGNRHDAVVGAAAYRGEATVYDLVLGCGTRARMSVAATGEGAPFEAGAAITVHWRPEDGVVLTR